MRVKAPPLVNKAAAQVMPAARKGLDSLQNPSKSIPLPALFTQNVNAFSRAANPNRAKLPAADIKTPAIYQKSSLDKLSFSGTFQNNPGIPPIQKKG